MRMGRTTDVTLGSGSHLHGMPSTRQRKQRTRGKRWQARHERFRQGSRHRGRRERAPKSER